MPRKFLFTKEEVTAAAVSLTREKGFDAVTARALGERLGSSSKPIFSLFGSMDELKQAVIAVADEVYRGYGEKIAKEGKYPPYKSAGMAYIEFAVEERELFRLLFMRDRTGEDREDAASIEPVIEIIMKSTGFDHETALLFHLEMWMMTHGIAVTMASSFVEWDKELASRMLTDGYMGLRQRFMKGENQ